MRVLFVSASPIRKEVSIGNTFLNLFAEQENITEELKATNQLEWVSKMNSIKNRAEEIIFNELIYV